MKAALLAAAALALMSGSALAQSKPTPGQFLTDVFSRMTPPPAPPETSTPAVLPSPGSTDVSWYALTDDGNSCDPMSTINWATGGLAGPTPASFHRALKIVFTPLVAIPGGYSFTNHVMNETWEFYPSKAACEQALHAMWAKDGTDYANAKR